MIGTCKLCLRENIELKVSHFLSKGIYRRLRDDGQRNPNPWLLTRTGAVQKSKQLKAPLLCGDCELRFCRNGEDWVLKYCLQGEHGKFPLAEILGAAHPDLYSPPNPTKLYLAARFPEIKVPDLAYFAASMYWRASIHGWNIDGSVPVNLGPFQERFRQYLMGHEPFPTHSCLWVVVREGKEFDRVTYAPVGARVDHLHAYKFPMPGIAFTLTVSKNIPTKYREMCFVHGQNNPIFVTNILEKFVLGDALKLRENPLTAVATRALAARC